jgi:hypothetical protein
VHSTTFHLSSLTFVRHQQFEAEPVVLLTALCEFTAQILDMELPPGSRILGARLLQGSGNGDNTHGAAAAAQGGSNAVRLLLLTSSQLICYVIKAP